MITKKSQKHFSLLQKSVVATSEVTPKKSLFPVLRVVESVASEKSFSFFKILCKKIMIFFTKIMFAKMKKNKGSQLEIIYSPGRSTGNNIFFKDGLMAPRPPYLPEITRCT